MNAKACIGTFICTFLLIVSCTENGNDTVISGEIDNPRSDTLFLESERIHYKFSDPDRIAVPVDSKGRFSVSLNADSDTYYSLLYNDIKLPVYIEPGKRIHLNIRDAHFPASVRAEGFGASYYQAYQEYLSEIESTEHHRTRERRKFLSGESNNYLNVQRLRIQLAKEYLGDTPFNDLVYMHIGEYLVSRLQIIQHNKLKPGFNVDLARRSVINEARYLDFFSLGSLKAQRAGIRDFAHEWVHTFGIRNELENRNVTFASGSWIAHAGEEVRRKRWELLDYIEDEQARSHAAMYLIAEELGDYEFDAGVELLAEHEPLVKNQKSYFSFLENLKAEVGQTQPGNPAVPFTIADQNGETVSLRDFRGSYVLLDFWAGWCIPCIEQLPYMNEIYENYDRADLEIVSISVDETEAAWRQALDRHPHPWIQLFDGDGFEQETFQAYRAGGIPFYVLISRDGTIIRNNDFRPSTNLPDILDQLLYEDIDHAYAGW